uniref:Uncharacterized protein n=1 Tax=Tetranychus urticae TaxID=32264 RepID=T1L3L4_TETUR
MIHDNMKSEQKNESKYKVEAFLLRVKKDLIQFRFLMTLLFICNQNAIIDDLDYEVNMN